MLTDNFATYSLPKAQQLEAWQGWYDKFFDVTPSSSDDDGFAATNSTWTVQGLTLSRVASPANTVRRTKSVIRSNSVDHWAITLSKQSASDVTTRGISFEAPANTPFILSFGEELSIARRERDERVQLILARDSFESIAALMDAATGMALSTPAARMLADYVLMLDQNVPTMEPEVAARLRNAVEAMLAACLAPTAAAVAVAGDQIRLTLMGRVRRAVSKNLRSPSLGPDRLCREADTSRSQLYRLLESEGGVVNYIQRRRLSEGFSLLSDATSNLSIGNVADILCFSDASSFSRAFRREFGMSPSDVRTMSYSAMPEAPTRKRVAGCAVRTFTDCVRGY